MGLSVYPPQWIAGAAMPTLFARKPSNTARTSTNTMAADPDLFIDITTTGLWLVELTTIPTYGNGGFIGQVAYTGTSGTAGTIRTELNETFFSGSPVAHFVGASAEALPIFLSGTESGRGLRWSATLDLTSSGRLSLRWSQNVVHAQPTTIPEGSWMRAEKVG